MVCLLAAPWVQLSVSAGNGWPHNALRHHWLMPISCHFRYCKALLDTSLTHVSGAIASVQTFTFVNHTELSTVQQVRNYWFHFYHAMLCIARTMPLQDVCASVPPSVTRRYSIETAKHIIKRFSLAGSHTIQVFPHQTAIAIFRRGSPTGGVECKGGMKK